MKKHFTAPWSTTVKLWTAAFLVLCGVIYFYADGFGALLIVAVVLLCLVFSVRGYSILDGRLLIHRLGWSKKFDLSELTSVEFNPDATLGSIRTWGIGGVFGNIGYFRNSILGTYRAYTTDSKNTVVLDFGGKRVVVTPGAPAEFAEAARSQQAK